jgi:hypothetical protein
MVGAPLGAMRTLNTIGTTASGRTNQDTPDDADHGGDRRRQVNTDALALG